MASYTGSDGKFFDGQLDTGRFKIGSVPNPSTLVDSRDYDLMQSHKAGGGIVSQGNLRPRFPSSVRFGGVKAYNPLADNSFERMYVTPRTLNLGIILSNVVTEFSVYNAFTETSQSWSGYDDTAAGIGVNMETPVPPPSIVIPRSSGITRDLTVTLIGPPTISATLDFSFLGLSDIMIPITGTRSTLFRYEPDNDLVEELEFLTDVLVAVDGTEQRRALRKNPRTNFSVRYLVDGEVRQRLENEIFEGHVRAFGIPRWHEATTLTADVNINDTAISVASTDYADYRNSGVAVVWQDEDNFEVLQISSFTSTVITFTSAFTQAFTAPARVMPVNTGLFDRRIKISRYRRDLEEVSLRFRVIDNLNDIASTAAFSSFNSKVFLDGNNFMLDETVDEAFNTNIILVDNLTGSPKQFTGQDLSKRSSSFTFITVDRQSAWEVRQLLHALKGQQISFYMASGARDFTPDDDILSADTSIDVKEVGYVNLVAQQQPRNVIRVVKKDGTASAPLTVVSSSSPAAGVERLDFSPTTVGINATVDEIDRIEYVHKVRWNDDKMRMVFSHAFGNMKCSIPTLEVHE